MQKSTNTEIVKYRQRSTRLKQTDCRLALTLRKVPVIFDYSYSSDLVKFTVSLLLPLYRVSTHLLRKKSRTFQEPHERTFSQSTNA